MQKTVLTVAIFILLTLFLSQTNVSAALFEPNNKVGIGMAGLDDQGIADASNMVNGDTGTMGYITAIIPEGDRDVSKWQGVCNKLRTERLIPIFRLATRSEGPNWRRPDSSDAIEWASFLNKLNCTTAQTYIVLFNEPNHATEWGGAVDPADYATRMLFFAKTLKNTNSNFFVMLGGLDQAAPQQPPNYYDAGEFWAQALAAQPTLFDFVDGLSAHCYNRGFSVSGFKETGRSSIRCYEWELSVLSGLGVNKELPVFITEAGWTGDPTQLSAAYKRAYETAWLPDNRVRAVTPFLLSYMGAPFEQFSFKKTDEVIKSDPSGRPFFEHYYAVSDIPKVKGNPPKNERVNVLSPLPSTIMRDSSYSFQLWIRNAGQSIWHKPEGYTIDFVHKSEITSNYSFSPLYNVETGDSTIINLDLETSGVVGVQDFSIGLFKDNVLKTVLFPWNVKVINPLPMNISLSVFPGKPYKGKATIQVFDMYNKMVFESKDVTFKDGLGVVEQVKGVSIGSQYRVVALADFYLPRQARIVVEEKNLVVFEMLIPGDSNTDGKFSVEDIFLMPTNKSLFRSFLPSLFDPNFKKLFSGRQNLRERIKMLAGVLFQI